MNRIDWDELKNAVENEEKEVRKTDVPVYSLEINGTLIEVEVESKEPSDNLYATRRRWLEYYKLFQCEKHKSDEVKDLYKSMFDFLISDYQHLLQSIQEDINELDICYSSGAYKATLILAGSILEAFLLDWLSENDGKNYFEEPYKIRVPKSDGTFKWEKKEQLNEYIEQIKEIERPDWMESGEKAHYIRESRNCVHAKVCLKKEIGVDAETCGKVITYLKDIIDTRLNKRKMELGL